MIKNLLYSLVLYIVCLALIALYSIVIQVVGNNFWPENTSGSLILDADQQIRGSSLLSQNTAPNIYFTPRPRYNNNNHCDVALYSDVFKSTLIQRLKAKKLSYDISSISHSASYLDPYITKAEALSQVSQIAKKRGLDTDYLIQEINKHSLAKSPPFFEIEIINTTILNMILERY